MRVGVPNQREGTDIITGCMGRGTARCGAWELGCIGEGVTVKCSEQSRLWQEVDVQLLGHVQQKLAPVPG